MAFMFYFFFPTSFSFRLFKRKIPLWATCTTTNEYAEETPRQGAFFHLEIPSVIISGASRARVEERRSRLQKLATTRWRGCLFYTTFYFPFLFISFLSMSWV